MGSFTQGGEACRGFIVKCSFVFSVNIMSLISDFDKRLEKARWNLHRKIDERFLFHKFLSDYNTFGIIWNAPRHRPRVTFTPMKDMDNHYVLGIDPYIPDHLASFIGVYKKLSDGTYERVKFP